LTFNGLTPGQVYYLMIDGFAGAICDYSVTVTSGGSTSTDVTLTPVNPTICINETVDLTATGGNGIYNWSPATGLSAVTGSTVTFTPPAPGVYTVTVQSTDTNALCATSDFVEITVLDLVTPTFNSIAPFCSGTTAPVLQGTSNNGITGTWLPAVVDNLNSGIYTFTPDAGQCATPVDISITVTPELTPSFITPAPICSGTAAPVLSNTSNNGVTGTWMPAVVDNMTSATYTFTPDFGQCASVVTLDVEVLASCTFGTVASAVMIDNCTTASPGEFFNTTAGSETIGAPTNVFPNSNLGTYVQNSGNLILSGAELRTFKTATSNVCSARLNYRIYEASSVPGAFTVVDLPLFDDCVGTTYPTGGNCVANDQKWQDISNTIDLTLFPAGDYIVEVFYDVTGDNSSTTLCRDTILLDNNGANYMATFSLQAIPTFVSVDPITCNGTEGSITVSGFNPGDTYSVTYIHDAVTVGPANFIADVNGDIIISGLNVGTYSGFDFSINGCNIVDNNPITLVDPVYTPTFNPIGPFCVGDTIILPVTSIEGFTGSWSPAVDNTQTIDYTFTPDAGQCSLTLTPYTVVVNPAPSVSTVTSNTPVCFGQDAVFTVTGTPNATLEYTINAGITQTTTLDATGSIDITVTAPAIGNVVLNLSDIDNGACNTSLTNSATVVVRALPNVTALTAIDASICLGSDAAFTISGSANATVTYQINGGADETIVLDAAGQSGTITIVNPTADVVILLSDITDGVCNAAVTDTITIVVNSVPVPTIDITTQPTCAVQTAEFNVLSPLNSVLNTPGDLFISEVTDAQTGSLTYVEIYNGTGATVDLSNYKLKIMTNGNPTPSVACNITLSGILANNDVVVVKLSTSANTGGVTPDLSFTTCSGVNNNDEIALATIGDVELDVWGINGTVFTPGVGYTYRRNTTAPLPSLTWDPADWTLIDPEDYSDVGYYSLYISDYEYILNDGTTTTTQTSTSFTGVAPGTYTLVAHDLLTGCFSDPLTFTINGVTFIDPVTDIAYTTPVCISGGANPLPDTSIVGFTSGGTFSANSTDVTIDSVTGEIDLATSVSGTYMITYEVITDATNCLNQGSSQFEIVIDAALVPTFNDLEVCTNSQVQLPSQSIEGYDGTWYPTTIDTSVEGTTIYYFTPSVSCSIEGELTVVVDNCTIQKGISPNGDSLNDYFDLSSYDVSRLQIFNRYGREVYSKSNYTIEWKGQANNGNELPDGTYYYVIEFNDMDSKTGWIYINRER
jgi:gliding motility-associated-like protein